MQLPLIAQDKANHFIYGYGVAVAVALVAHHVLQLPRPLARLVGAGTGCLAGAVKEGADWWRNRRALRTGQGAPHEASWGDGLTTAMGAIAYWSSAEATGG